MTEALRDRFGKYHVLEKIAQGGMAEVYKVKTVGIAGFEKIQALKRILPHSAREGRFIRSFIDEARIAVELAHRNIVQVFDFGKADGELFLAMELIEGKDLRTAMGQAVTRELLPSAPVAAYVVSEVAAGLDYAHRKTDGYGGALGIVHCDVSPSNVMLSTDGYVKILDFGIARATFSSALERRRLRGKPRYMAPEQTLGEPATAASDVFALGIIAWELFTGLPLFHGADVKAILDAVRYTHPPRIDQINPQAPGEIAAAIATALSREPAARGSVADLAGACARTAMAAGARAVAAWLGELDRRPSAVASEWQVQATSMSVPGRTDEPAERYSARSVTHSLLGAPVPASSLGEGTPGFPLDPSSELPTTPARRKAAGARVDPTVSISVPLSDVPDVPASRATTTMRWTRSDTASGVPRLADAVPPEPAATVPYTRVAFEELQLESMMRPSVARLDDEVTHHRAAATPAGPDDTSYDELELEGEVSTGGTASPDEPIDDDLGAIGSGVPGERRRTVVVAGVVAGAAADLLRLATRSLGELAYQRGGVVTAIDDDALVIAFGLEVAGEDDVAVAMGWALDAIAMVRDAGDVTLRVGARTGVATTVGPDGAPQVPQDAIDEARLLAREASPEHPLFAGGAGRLTSGLYALREVPAPRLIARQREGEDGRRRAGGEAAVRMLARRSRVIEVVGPRGFDERDRARLERRGKLVGRAAQLAELDLWYQRAIAADRRLAVLISGAAGTGKSRLVAEMIARRTGAGATVRVVTAAASPAGQHAPFATVIDLYQSALGLPPARGRAARGQIAQRLSHLLHGAGVATLRAREIVTDLDRAMELRDGIGLGVPERADLQQRISAGLSKFRNVMAHADRPMITLIEDIHLADTASLEVLRHALAAPAIGPELLVLTSRPEGAAPVPPRPTGEAGRVPTPPSLASLVEAVIAVGDLVGAELRALIADRLGDAATPLNIAAVLARGGGNPLFVEELVDAVRDAGKRGEDVPASARDVIAARIDRLSAKARSALRFAAVLGGAVRVRLLEELLGEAEASLGGEIAELVTAGFLARRGDEAADGSSEGELYFTRGLVREVVYDALSARARRDGHARAGKLLASRFFAGREEPPAAIAEHLERGGEPAGAAAFWLRGGRLALAASDALAAAGCFTRTLALERELGSVPATPTSRARRREALAGREEAHRLIGDLASDPGDLDDLQRLCEGEPGRLADVAIRRAQRMLRLGDYPGASAATVVAENHAITARDHRLTGEALRVRGEILERLGRFDEALAAVGAAGELFHRRRLVHDEMAAMLGRGRIHLLRGHYEAAREAHRPVLRLIDQTGDPWLERIVTNHVAVIELCVGDFPLAMTSIERSLELCRRHGDRAREGDGLTVVGIILREVGLHDEAAATFTTALDVLARTASRWSRADCLIHAGTCELRRGRPGALPMIDEALAEARRLGARYLEASALVARAGAQLHRGAHAAAAEDAAAAVLAARAAALVGHEIRGLAHHALALARLGARGDEAAALVHRALELLEHKRQLEGSEEEVLAACVEVLRATGARDRAALVRQRGRISAHRKLGALVDPAWRAAYLALPEIRDLLA